MLRSLPRRLAGAIALLALAAAPAAAQRAAPPTLPSILVSADWLAAHLGDPGLVVLHVLQPRQVAAFEAGHVPGARVLRYDRIAGEVDGLAVELLDAERVRAAFAEAGVGDGSRVVLVGEPMAAARAWMTLDWLGLGDRAALLDGGMTAWRAGRHPVERGAAAPVAPATLAAGPRAERVVDAAWVRARLGDPRVALVDARPPDEYTGADGGRGHLLAGHIPGARNLHWERLLVSRDDPRFRPAAELRALLEQAVAAPDRTVLTYCMIGMRASVTYFASRLLGYDTRFYDGSWDDWSRRGLPAVGGRGRERGTEGAASRETGRRAAAGGPTDEGSVARRASCNGEDVRPGSSGFPAALATRDARRFPALPRGPPRRSTPSPATRLPRPPWHASCRACSPHDHLRRPRRRRPGAAGASRGDGGAGGLARRRGARRLRRARGALDRHRGARLRRRARARG